MDEYLKANQKLWNERTDEHEKSPFDDQVEGFKGGRSARNPPSWSRASVTTGDSGASTIRSRCCFR
jgi:hypothetical protein